MKIIVCIKQVPDTETKIQIKPDGSAIDEQAIKWIINPYDEFAIEESLKLKEQTDGHVCVMSAGPAGRITEALRTALAMGADSAVALDSTDHLDSHQAAQAMAAYIKQKDDFSIIFCGKMAIDHNQASTGQRLAELLNIPHTNVVSKFSIEDQKVCVSRDGDSDTTEIVEMNIPCLVGTNKGLNTPRYASLPGIMKAKKKPIETVKVSTLGVKEMKISLSDFQLPSEKPPTKMLDGEVAAQCRELVQLLREDAKVL